MIESGFTPAARFNSAMALVVGLVIALVAGLALAASPAEAKYMQPKCKKQAKAVAKAKGSAKRTAKLRLKSCVNNRKAYNRIKDSRFTGIRSDGIAIDIVLCADGTVADDPESEFGQVFRKGWRIDVSSFRGKYFEAGFAAKIDGGERVGAIKFDKTGWQVGIYSLGSLTEYGPATRTDAKKLCRTL